MFTNALVLKCSCLCLKCSCFCLKCSFFLFYLDRAADHQRGVRREVRAVVARAHGPQHPRPEPAAGVLALGAARGGARGGDGAGRPEGGAGGPLLQPGRHDGPGAAAAHRRESSPFLVVVLAGESPLAVLSIVLHFGSVICRKSCFSRSL